MKNKQGALLLAVILAAPAFAFADDIPGHSTGASKYVTFSEGFTGEQNLRGNSAQCNFLLGAPKENGLSTSSIKSSELGSGGVSSGNSVRLVDFSGDSGASPDKDKGKGKGKQGGGSGDVNGTTSGNGGPSPLIVVSEPGSQSLLLFGLGGLGMLAFRRKTFTNAI